MINFRNFFADFIGTKGFLLLLFALSVFTSIVVISSSPFGYFSGDLQTYLSLGREIAANGMLVPSANSIHYPGSAWVYPPVVPEITAIFYLISPAYAIYILSGFSIFIVAATSIPIFYLTRNLFGKESGALAGLAYSLYFPSIYEETWGGLPQLVALLLILVLLSLITSHDSIVLGRRRIALIASISFVVPFIHDLSSIILLASLVVVVAGTLVSGLKDRRVLLRTVISVIAMAVGVAIWYLPRLWWVIDSVFPSKNSVYSALVSMLPIYTSSHSVLSSIQSLRQPSAILAIVPLGWALIIILFIVSVACAFYYLARRDILIMLPLLLVPVFLMIYNIFNPVLLVRLSYFVYLYSFILLSPFFLKISKKMLKILFVPHGKRSVAPPLILAVIVILSSVGGIAYERTSHTYFGLIGSNAENNSYGLIAAQALASAYSSGVVAASGQIGFVLMGEFGIPVAEYQPLAYLTQPVEWKESAAAYVLIFTPDLNTSNTLNLIGQFNVTYVVMDTMVGTPVPPFYHLIYENDFYTVFGT